MKNNDFSNDRENLNKARCAFGDLFSSFYENALKLTQEDFKKLPHVGFSNLEDFKQNARKNLSKILERSK